MEYFKHKDYLEVKILLVNLNYHLEDGKYFIILNKKKLSTKNYPKKLSKKKIIQKRIRRTNSLFKIDVFNFIHELFLIYIMMRGGLPMIVLLLVLRI